MTAQDPRLSRFVRGELSEEEILAFEEELDRRPSLRRELVALARSDETEPSRGGAGVFESRRRIEIGRPLGQGGMGTVRRGIQRELGRSVAVKTLRNETPSGTHRLLQEARLTSRLQHPNIVPVHEIVRGGAGELQVVLKEVEGVPWSSVMHDPEEIRRRFGAEDALDWNLKTLVSVCNALTYAHERGIVHRDVKPSNVMIGDHGEVYLLDWGIAAQWGERVEPDLAHVEDAPIAGTLAYMAPEQLEGDPEAIGPWTDVYLLGATLYEVVARAAPHAFVSREVSRVRPRARRVPPLEDAPAELATLIMQALAPELEDRFVSAAAFRSAVEAFRSHRGSRDLVLGAERRRKVAREARARDDAAAFERALADAEFALRAALEAWPANVEATAGLREVAMERIEAALADGRIDVARAALTAMEEPPPELRARVERALAAEEEARATGARAAWDQDPKVGVGVRGAILALFAPVWVVGWTVAATWPGDSAWPLVILLSAFVVVGTLVVLWRGVALLQNQLNRSNILGGAITVGGGLLWTITCQLRALGYATTRLGLLLVFTLIPAMYSVTSDRRGLTPSALSLACFVFAAAMPAYAGQALAGAAILLAFVTVINNVLLRRRMKNL